VADRVLITCPQMQVAFPTFADRFDGLEVDLPRVLQALSEPELLEIIDRYDGVIAGDDHFSALVLERATRLRVLSKWGVGVDGIDRVAAERLGIHVANTPGAFDGEVADVCVGYLIMLSRGLHLLDRGVRAGYWPKIEGTSLGGRTLGIVGLGGIGRALARRAAAMEIVVVGTDPDPAARERAVAEGVDVLDLDEVLARAEYLSLHCPLTADNVHLLDADSIARLPRGARVVNTARGQLISEDALVDALAGGHIAGVALDVFEHEPLHVSSPLRSFDQCIFGSHNASNTAEAVMRTSERAVDNLFAGLATR
jgi:D-3-phosphoglycerate dehydrogenase